MENTAGFMWNAPDLHP